MSCDYSLTGHLQSDCVPTAVGYNSEFYLTAWADWNTALTSSSISINQDTTGNTHIVKVGDTVSAKCLVKFADMRTAVFTGSTKAKADSPLSVPWFTKTIQIGVDKNAYMDGTTNSKKIADNSAMINVLTAGRVVLIAERTDGTGYEVFGGLSPLKATAVDQSLANDDSNSGMITLTFEATEGDYSVLFDATADELAKLLKATT